MKKTLLRRKLQLSRTSIAALEHASGGADSTYSPCGPTKWQCGATEAAVCHTKNYACTPTSYQNCPPDMY